ncbi:MAG: MgtC/SapB family protein [Fretibacterium sp.]|nr:MgtC/SapB family protein [Fretibacterium sp.]
MIIEDPIARLLGTWATGINLWSVLFRIGLSVLLASIVGCERSSKRHSAGLRTFILVSLASASSAMIDICLLREAGETFAVVSAAAVVATAMISGNSILFSSKSQIKGLTTSAGLWACSVVGISIGMGFYTLTLISFAALLCILSQFPRFEAILKDRSNHFEVHLELKNSANLQDFVTTIRKLGLRIDDIESNPAYVNSGLSVYSVSMTISEQDFKKYRKHSEIIEALRSLDYIHYIEEMN